MAPALRLALLAVVVAVGCGPSGDVVLVAIDTLRVDHVGAFDPHSPARTPAIDRLARDSVLAEQAWSPISVTGPAFATVLSGQGLGRHGVTKNRIRGGTSFRPDSPSLAAILGEAGYATAAFVSGFTLRPELGLDRGFAVYSAPPADAQRFRGDDSTERAIGWLSDQRGAVFLWLHLYDPHGPLRVWDDPPAEGSWRSDADELRHIPDYQRIAEVSDPALYRARYVTGVEFADRQVGRLLDALRESGRYDDALIVFLADHGETFTERDWWFDHGTYAYAEQLHVPLLVKYPGNAGAGRHLRSLVSLLDVAPTVLDVVGLPAPDSMQGRSLASGVGRSVVVGESEYCKPYAILRCPAEGRQDKAFAARDDQRSLVLHPTSSGLRREVYDRRADPAELEPLDETPPAALANAVRALVAARTAGGEAPAAGDASPEEIDALRALGYLR